MIPNSDIQAKFCEYQIYFVPEAGVNSLYITKYEWVYSFLDPVYFGFC